MSYTLDQVINRVSTVLHDVSTAIWGTAEIGQAIDDGLVEIATYKPYVVLATATPPSGTPDLDISSISDLLYGYSEDSFEAVEFQIDKEPKRFRNFQVHGSSLTFDIKFNPDGTDTARLYCHKPHILGGSGTTSLNPELERLLIDLVAARVAINYSIDLTDEIARGGAQTPSQFISWGERKLALTLKDLRNLVEWKPGIRWPQVV